MRDMKKSVSILSVAILLTLFPACDLFGGGGHTTETDEAREKWSAYQDGDYSFTVTRSCFCANAGTYWVQVVDGDITIVQRVQDHEYLPEEQFEGIPTVDDLFNLIDRALRESADDVQYAFDPDAGYPSSITIDWYRQAIDDEIHYSVSGAGPGITVPD